MTVFDDEFTNTLMPIDMRFRDLALRWKALAEGFRKLEERPR